MVRYWNDGAGPAWVAMQERLDAQIAAHGRRTFTRLAAVPGERVLDLGCGCGGTTLEIAEALGETGRVLGVDVSAPMLALARARADAAGLAGRIEFREADAQTADLGTERFDAVFSRFGVMFFDDPVRAFTNVRRALRPGGRLAFVCWQARERNPWMTVPALAAMKHVPFPPPPPADAPGPCAFADPARVRGILERAGFAAIAFEAMEDALPLTGERTEEVFLAVGPVGQALREAKATDEQRARVMAAIREAIETFRTPRGLRAPAAAWIVSARRGS
jgi:SAM-dependent methyltransferase